MARRHSIECAGAQSQGWNVQILHNSCIQALTHRYFEVLGKKFSGSLDETEDEELFTKLMP